MQMLNRLPLTHVNTSHASRKRTQRRYVNAAQAARARSPSLNENQASTNASESVEQQQDADAQVPHGRNRYPQLGLRLSTWVDEQKGGAPAQWLEPFYTTLSGTSTASVAFSSSATNEDVAEDGTNGEAGDGDDSDSASSGLRAPRIGVRQKGLLEGQLQDLRQTPLPLSSPTQNQTLAVLFPPSAGPSSDQSSISSQQPQLDHHGRPQQLHHHHHQLQQQHHQHHHQQQQQIEREGSLSQEEVREVLLAEGCPAPKRLVQGVQYMVEQQCFPGGRAALSNWLQGISQLEGETTLQIRAMLPGCYHIMLRSVDELQGTCAALTSLLGFTSPAQLAEYVTRNPHLLYKPAQQLLADFEVLLHMTHLPRYQLVAMAASNPGLLGCTHEGLRVKWQRLQAAAACSNRWQAELQGLGSQADTDNGSNLKNEGADEDLSHEGLMAAALCAPHASIDRLVWLKSEGLQESTSMLQAITRSATDFNREHPGYKHFQSHHALLGAHYAASTHPLQRLVLEGGADLPRGSAGRWVNLHLQLRKQVEDAKRAEEERGQFLDIQHALADEIVMMDEWEMSAHQWGISKGSQVDISGLYRCH